MSVYITNYFCFLLLPSLLLSDCRILKTAFLPFLNHRHENYRKSVFVHLYFFRCLYFLLISRLFFLDWSTLSEIFYWGWKRNNWISLIHYSINFFLSYSLFLIQFCSIFIIPFQICRIILYSKCLHPKYSLLILF